jgi:type IV fimbrial biogenesis protein FimT
LADASGVDIDDTLRIIGITTNRPLGTTRMGTKRFKRILSSGSPARRHAAAGFTLIELLVVVSLISVMLAITLPSFRSIVERNRISSQINSFVGDMQFARSEAIKRGRPVSICPSSNGTSCLTANTWHSGWIVFTDDNGSCTMETGDTAVRYRKAWGGTDTFAATSSTSTCFSYNRDGFANVTAATVVMHTTPVNNSATRCVEISRVGRSTVQAKGAGSCT